MKEWTGRLKRRGLKAQGSRGSGNGFRARKDRSARKEERRKTSFCLRLLLSFLSFLALALLSLLIF